MIQGRTMQCDFVGCGTSLTIPHGTREEMLDKWGKEFHVTRCRDIHICRACLERVIEKELAGIRERWNITGVH